MGTEDGTDSGSILIHLTGEQVSQLPDGVRHAVSDLAAQLREIGSVTPAEEAGSPADIRAQVEQVLAENRADELLRAGVALERVGWWVTCPGVINPILKDASVIVLDGEHIVLPQA
ncbi:hypothetical protein [Actinoplanes flavus]|uniref:Uncharacterized protein n=1 Tax=Actinoplanes flavus TaxID=2820290 RepID=A0ABS3UUI0_9ACTN|nr:hypothetical protein [Actinoplanes flavus]MBO3742248.1 hypothetical protein [Actinoplanes flavus]